MGIICVSFYLFLDNVYRKFEECLFFDDQIKPDMFFLTIHDAVLYIEEKRKFNEGHDPLMEKVKEMWPFYFIIYG